MKTIVITGSTQGIGLGMAAAFLSRGAQVMLCSRRQQSVDAAIQQLSTTYPAERIHGLACDVSVLDQVQALWDASIARFGCVDIWINNAGLSTPQLRLWELDKDDLDAVMHTNFIGVMYGSRVALQGMQKQGSGALYNMEGFGSDGSKMAGMTVYGTTKYALRYLTEALAQEVKDTPVIVCTLSPGMVITRMLVGKYDKSSEEWTKVKKIFNILADKSETVCPWLAEKVLNNQKNGAAFRWLTTPSIIWRFISAPFRKRDLFADESSPLLD